MALDPITAGLDVVTAAINKIWPDKSQVEKDQIAMQFAILKAQFDAATAQTDINKIEAANPNLFVSGARPFIMWICAGGLAIQFVIFPLIAYGFQLTTGKIVAGPALDMGTLMTLLFAMLGLGAMRTTEKIQGVAK